MTPASMKEMKKEDTRNAVGLQRLQSEKREIEMKDLFDPFHNPADNHKRHRDDETAQKTIPLLPDFFFVYQFVLNL